MFVRDNITEDDILVVDVGGNDVALHPTCGVIFNIILLLYLTPTCLSLGEKWSVMLDELSVFLFKCLLCSFKYMYDICTYISRFPLSKKPYQLKTSKKHTYIYMSLPFFFLVGFSGCEGIIRCCPWLAPGMWYFIYMFRVRLRRLVQKLIAKRKPKKVVICTSESFVGHVEQMTRRFSEDPKSND